MKKLKNLFFIINLSAAISIVEVCAVNDHHTVQQEEVIGLQEFYSDLEVKTTSFRLHPHRYWFNTRFVANRTRTRINNGQGDESPIELITELITGLQGYTRMLSQKAKKYKQSEVIESLKLEIEKLKELMNLVSELDKDEQLTTEIEEKFNHFGISQLITQANKDLVESFNYIQRRPLTYEEIQNRVEAFKSERGIPSGITITEIISLLKQIKKSEKAGLIYTFKPTDYQNNITYPTFAIARYAEPYPQLFFILPFKWSFDL